MAKWIPAVCIGRITLLSSMLLGFTSLNVREIFFDFFQNITLDNNLELSAPVLNSSSIVVYKYASVSDTGE